MKILVTGAAGFIGFHMCEKLAKSENDIYGIDNINNYYDVGLKYDRLKELGFSKKNTSRELNEVKSKKYKNLRFSRLDITDLKSLDRLFKKEKFDVVCHLAAQAGVRYSIINPSAYTNSNIIGFLNLLECCRQNNIKKLVYASSSSVYGNNKKIPFDEKDNVDNPISLYAASKKSNELMAHAYSHLYSIETIGLRFFTVYGPWGRPDMAYYLFTKAIINNETINVFNNGKLTRDFTYIDDIVNGVSNTLLLESKNTSLYKLYNIGNGSPVNLLDFIQNIEMIIGKKSLKNMLPSQPGDVNQTYANTNNLEKDYFYKSNTDLKFGVEKFVSWYKNYYLD